MTMKKRASPERKKPIKGVRRILAKRRFQKEAKPWHREREALTAEVRNNIKLARTLEYVGRIKSLEEELQNVMHKEGPHITSAVNNARRRLDGVLDEYGGFREELRSWGVGQQEFNRLHQRAEQQLAKRQEIRTHLKRLRKKHGLE
jgi:hypothetical protein